MRRLAFILAILLIPALSSMAQHRTPQHALGASDKEHATKIDLLWTDEDRDVFTESIVPYSHRYLDGKSGTELNLIIWGPAVKLLAEDDQLQNKLASMIDKGLQVKTSQFLTDQYGVTEELTEIGVEVGKTKDVLTETLTEDASHVVSL
jgi:hypothetical protein